MIPLIILSKSQSVITGYNFRYMIYKYMINSIIIILFLLLNHKNKNFDDTRMLLFQNVNAGLNSDRNNRKRDNKLWCYCDILSIFLFLNLSYIPQQHIEQNHLSYTEDWSVYMEYQGLFIKNILNEMVFHSSIAC
jgi:hypothetical protein